MKDRSPRSTRLAKRLAIAAVMVTTALMLVAFRPFTPVQSVCPKCPVKGDRVMLKSGKAVVAKVVGKNQDGYILARYGELRFIQFREISKVAFQSGAEPKGITNYDQILLKDKSQTLLHGTLIAIEPGKPLALRSVRGQVYMVNPEQVLVYYHRGKRRAPPKKL
ncbi:MAG: hypothetical protein KC502_06530 [Myxococcales bacterium]|nr:hypothetical protein [Myxococcales bacterium]